MTISILAPWSTNCFVRASKKTCHWSPPAKFFSRSNWALGLTEMANNSVRGRAPKGRTAWANSSAVFLPFEPLQKTKIRRREDGLRLTLICLNIHFMATWMSNLLEFYGPQLQMRIALWMVELPAAFVENPPFPFVRPIPPPILAHVQMKGRPIGFGHPQHPLSAIFPPIEWPNVIVSQKLAKMFHPGWIDPKGKEYL